MSTPQSRSTDHVAFVFVDDLVRPTTILATHEHDKNSTWSLPLITLRAFQDAREGANLHLTKILPPRTGGVLKATPKGPVHRGKPPATSTQAGKELTSQIGQWPTASDALCHVYYVQLADGLTLDDAAACMPHTEQIALAEITEKDWHPDHIAPVIAARSELLTKATKPSWTGHRTFGALTFSPLSESDIPDLAKLWSYAEVTQNLGHRPLSLAQTKLYVQGRLSDAAGGSYIPVTCRENGQFIGEARVTLSPQWSCHGPTGKWNAKVGFAVLPQEQGRGLGTAIMKELVTVCFDDLKVHAIRATVFDRSKPSAAVMTKCGFTHCGTNPDSFRDIAGGPIDDLQFVFTQTDYLKQKSELDA